MAEELKIGDVVLLASGGPQMTIVEMDGEDGCFATWFDKSGKRHQEYFMKATLRKPPPPAAFLG